MRGDEREEHVQAAVLGHHPADRTDHDGVVDEHVDRERARDPEPDALRGDPRVVGPDHRGEPGRRVVVLRERLLDVLLALARRHERGERVRLRRDPDPGDHGEHEAHGRHRHRPPADPVEGGRQRPDDESHDVAPRRFVRPRDGVPGPAEQVRELGHRRGVGCGRADGRQVGRDRLVEAHELVGLGAGQPALAGERVEAPPLLVAHGGEGIQVHSRYPATGRVTCEADARTGWTDGRETWR